MYEVQLRNIFRIAQFPVEAWAHRNFVLTTNMVQQLRPLPYLERWNLALTSEWYHIKMEDHSLFQFQEGGANSSLSYVQCPLDVPTFRQFLQQSHGVELNQATKRQYQAEYDMVLQTAGDRRHVAPIRCDRDPHAYRAGVHPLCHIHIGLDNDIRIALRREMSAIGFVLLIMRQHYPLSWERLLDHHAKLKLSDRIRHSCAEIAHPWWELRDEIELCLA